MSKDRVVKLLVVNVVDINSECMRRAGLPQYTSQDIIRLTMGDEATWNVFHKGWTQGINQCQGKGTTENLKIYKPTQLRDLSAFVAAIRPGFKSMLSKFLHRSKFNYDVEAFDSVLKNDSSGSSWLLYQEDIMHCLNLAGIEMSEAYKIIKAISKKKLAVINSAKEQFLVGFKSFIMKTEDMSESEAEASCEIVWRVILDAASYSFNACVAGRTKIFRDPNGRFEPTVEEMYKIKNDKGYAIRTGHKSLHSKYRNYGYGAAYSMFEDGRCLKNNIVDIREAGVRSIYKIKTADGGEIECTDNHKFPTSNGKKRCDELNIGDYLYMMGEYEKSEFNAALTDGTFSSNVPTAGQKGFQKRPDGASVKFNSFRLECISKNHPCSCCNKEYSDDIRFEVHHKNMDRHNNEMCNFEWLCVSCHKKRHYSCNRRRKGQKGYPTYLSEIVSIEYIGEEMTYDVEMQDPAHNFVVESRLVTCNSHSVCVSLDALYGAYLKAHYPMEYYSTLLDAYGEKGKKEKVAEIKQEMRIAFGIEIVPCKFRQDNRSFFMDKQKKQMADALNSVKYVSKTVANELYKMRNNKFDSFVSMLCALDDNRAFGSRVIKILIRMGYFSEFGSGKKLMHVYDEFRDGKNRITKQLKDATRVKRIAALKQYELSADENEFSPEEQVVFESEYFGAPISVFKESKGKFVVLNVETKYSPRATLYSIGTGSVGKVKLLKRDYQEYPFNAGDVLVVKHHTKKQAMSFIEGKRVPKKGVFDIWVDAYDVIHIDLEKEE